MSKIRLAGGFAIARKTPSGRRVFKKGLRVGIRVYRALTVDSKAATRFSRTANSSISTFLLREFFMNH